MTATCPTCGRPPSPGQACCAAAQHEETRLVILRAIAAEEERNDWRARALAAEAFLRCTAYGGAIVSSASLTPEEIAIYRAGGRMLVMSDGLGIVYVPAVSGKAGAR